MLMKKVCRYQLYIVTFPRECTIFPPAFVKWREQITVITISRIFFLGIEHIWKQYIWTATGQLWYIWWMLLKFLVCLYIWCNISILTRGSDWFIFYVQQNSMLNFDKVLFPVGRTLINKHISVSKVTFKVIFICGITDCWSITSKVCLLYTPIHLFIDWRNTVSFLVCFFRHWHSTFLFIIRYEIQQSILK